MASSFSITLAKLAFISNELSVMRLFCLQHAWL